MEQLQFIRIITNDEGQTSPEEIRLAFDGFMQYCQRHDNGPAEFQDILFIHEILSSYTHRTNDSHRSKKKSYTPSLHVPSRGSYRRTHTNRGIQNALSAGRDLYATCDWH